MFKSLFHKDNKQFLKYLGLQTLKPKVQIIKKIMILFNSNL
jgi:hypothetical protein